VSVPECELSAPAPRRDGEPTREVGGESSGLSTSSGGKLELMDLRLHAPRPDVVIVRVSGPVEGLAARLLADRVGKQLHRAPHVIIDLGEVSVLSPRGVAVLSTLHQQALVRGTRLHIVGAEDDAVHRPLYAMGLAHLLSLESTADAVIAALSDPVVSAVAAGRIGLGPEDGDPSRDLGQGHARPIGPSGERDARLLPAAAGQRDGMKASVPRHRPAQREHTNRAVIACLQQWQDAELAMNVARRCFEGWRQAGREETPPSVATRHTCHTHEALHEALRAIALVIEMFRVKVMTRASTLAESPLLRPAVESMPESST